MIDSDEGFQSVDASERTEARENELNRSIRQRELQKARALEDARLLAPLQHIYFTLFRNQGLLLINQYY